MRRPDGAVVLRSRHALGPFPVRITDRLDELAARDPDRVLFAQRAGGGGGWRTITYGAARDAARRIAGALLARKLSAERPALDYRR